MTILQSPSGSWVKVKDAGSVRIYLRHGWVERTLSDVLEIMSDVLDDEEVSDEQN